MFQQDAPLEQPNVYMQQMRGFLEKRPCSNKLHPISSVFSEPAAVRQKTLYCLDCVDMDFIAQA